MGVWIETMKYLKLTGMCLSHPAWVCGLKHVKHACKPFYNSHTLRGCVDWNSSFAVSNVTSSSVTPCVGVWIETNQVYGYPDYPGHTLRGCVDWNLLGDDIRSGERSHTLRGCVDWNFIRMIHNNQQEGHTLRGCVDWNHDDPKHNNLNLVTPCVGVWIETLLRV